MNPLSRLINLAITKHEARFPQSKVYSVSAEEQEDRIVVELRASHFSHAIQHVTIKPAKKAAG